MHKYLNLFVSIYSFIPITAITDNRNAKQYESAQYKKKYVSVNIGGTALMLDILTNVPNHVKRVLVAESRAVYGEGRYWSENRRSYVYPEAREAIDMQHGEFEIYDDDHFKLKLVSTTEDSLIHPTSVYGVTKQVQ